LLLKGAEQYQSIVRVPFIWTDPQANDCRRRSAALASTIDIAATVLERAQIEPFDGMQGQSLLPALTGAPVRDCVFIQYEHQAPSPLSGKPPRVHSVIDERYRLSVFDAMPWGELYGLAEDPGEFNNLWDDPAHAASRARMLERLAHAEIAHMDRVPLPTRRA
jgi:arylsulfatase A-like enzyme